MQIDDLKSKLLSIGYLNDDEWLNKYVLLIVNNRLDKKIKYQSARHHIIPKCYYFINNLEVDDSSENTVFLFHTDHALAHLYLSQASKNIDFKRKNLSSMWFVLSRASIDCDSDTKDTNDFSEILDYIKLLTDNNLLIYPKPEEACNAVSNSAWYNNGVIEKYFTEQDTIPEGFVLGRLPSDRYHINNSDRVWINNGIEQHHVKTSEVDAYLLEGFTKGMLDRGSSWYDNVSNALRNRSDTWCANISKGR